jgi:lactoylglutathione lyase
MNMSSSADVIPGRPTWQQTMLRIRDPAKSIPFYTDLLGFTLIDTFDFPQYKFSLYFLTTLSEGKTYNLTPGTQEAHNYLWNMEGVALELTHNHGTEKEGFDGYHPGNQKHDGFGHIAVRYGRITNDLDVVLLSRYSRYLFLFCDSAATMSMRHRRNSRKLVALSKRSPTKEE